MIAAYAAAEFSRSIHAFTPFSHLSIRSKARIITSFTRNLSLSSSTSNVASNTDSTPIVHNRIPIGDTNLEGGLDNRILFSNLDLVLSHLRSRRTSPETLETARRIASRQQERVSLQQTRDTALRTRNEQSTLVGTLMRQLQSLSVDEDSSTTKVAVDDAKARSAVATEEAAVAETQLSKLEAEVSSLLATIPNLLDDTVPDGDNEENNEIIYTKGDLSALPTRLGWSESFEPQWHDDIASSLNGYHPERAAAMSGARFPLLSGCIARLERAISSFFLDLHTSTHGYIECSAPLIVSRSSLEGTSQLPKFELDLFRITNHQCNSEDAFLIPTAEVPLTNIHRGDVLDGLTDLPLSYAALTQCFRAEAGSYGRDVRGLIRSHQFPKVELVKICKADESRAEHEKLTEHAERCLELLELPYRKVRLCSGDVGFGARLCYDLEVWLPGSGEYREISSCSNMGDFQARRLGLRYRPAETAITKGGKKRKKIKPVYCHTINGSGLAVGRALVAVLENYQMPNGFVSIPKVLRPYMGGLEMLKK